MSEIKKNYTLDKVNVRVVNDESDKKVYIIFSTLLETLFYSPGIKLKRDEKNDIYIEFIRVGIHDEIPEIDLKAEYLTKWLNDNKLPAALKEKIQNKSIPAEQIFVISEKVGNIYITDGQNNKIIWTDQYKE